MTDLRTAAQQALEALESTQLYCAHEHYPRRRVADALDALKAALEQPEQPVADAMKTVIKAMQADPDYAWSWHCNVAMAFVDAGGDSYTANQGAARFMRLLANVDPAHELPPHPPRREWRVLTEEDMIDIQDRCGVTVLRDEFIAIEAALKEKNHHE